jgi:HlyD family secretion protein
MNGKKILLIVAILILVTGGIAGTVLHSRSDVPAVTTAKAVQEDLISTVSGTGQIKPKTYVNVGATAFGRITHLYVKEGDHAKKGDILATIENVQPESTVAAQQATIASSRTDVSSYIAAEKTATAAVDEAKADLEQKRLDFGRAQQLYDEKLIAKQDFDSKKAAYDVSVATLAQRQAALAQANAQTASQRGHVQQAIASQRANYDALDKTVSRAPFNGLVTNVPVREGETVVVGIQNAEGSTLMTLADMSVITAEVKVDETDIVNVTLGQTASVTVDAFPNQTFTGHVTEVGDQALLRTTGVATSQSTTGTEEAKDFKVVVTLDSTKVDLRPGLSCTAKITTAHKPDTLTIPIQALVMRDSAAEATLFKDHGKSAAVSSDTTPGKQATLIQGVYVVADDNGHLRARFVPVTTGITGTTDIEALSGLKQGDEIVTGHYKTLRTLKSGITVKHDTAIVAPAATDDSSS